MDNAIESTSVIRSCRFRENQVGNPTLFHTVDHGISNRVITLCFMQFNRTISVYSPNPLNIIIRPVTHDVSLVNTRFHDRRARPGTVSGPNTICRPPKFLSMRMFDTVTFNSTFSNHGHSRYPLIAQISSNVCITTVMSHLESDRAWHARICNSTILADDIVEK